MGDEKQTELLSGPTHHAGLATIPLPITPSWFNAPPGIAQSMGSRPDFWRNEYCIAEVTSKDVLDLDAHFFCDDGTSWCKTFCPPLCNVMAWPYENMKIFVSQGRSWTRNACQPRS